ncbi:hypothetical protein aq_2067 [Aquifex aeolicus VF5]|uniref:Thiamine-binding protein domain-containing protein n=2 Tax=Aquifex aeolicus TaxID=63363 RepID=O67847_AQUAE|nr:hypothetical protein aq_2067 [Aquifex aeolicus VF5]
MLAFGNTRTRSGEVYFGFLYRQVSEVFPLCPVWTLNSGFPIKYFLMSFLVFVSMTPLGKGESVSQYVARVVDIIDKSGLPYVLTPMGTIIEGEDWDEVMEVLKKGFEALKEDCNRISITMKIDYRKGKKGRLIQKVKSVQEKIGRDINIATVEEKKE